MREPLREVDGSIRAVVDRQAMGGTIEDYLGAIRCALASKENLADLIGLDLHTDEAIREYLRAIETKLAARLEP
jgi:hypothetical protein